MSLFVSTIFAQTQDEINIIKNNDDFVKSTIKDLSNNYLIFIRAGRYVVIEKKSSSNYKVHYFLDEGPVKNNTFGSNAILNTIFTNFTPINGVHRYLSSTNHTSKCPAHMLYFAIFKNNVKTFDSRLPSMFLCGEGIADMEYPYNDEVFRFLVNESLALNKD